MQQNTNHLEQFAWPQPHQTVYGNNTFHFKESSSSYFVCCEPTFCFVIPLCVCVTSPWAPLRVRLTSACLSRGGTPKISNCIHSFSAPGKKRRRKRKKGMEGESKKEMETGSTGSSQGGIWGRRKDGEGGGGVEVKAISSVLQLRHH